MEVNAEAQRLENSNCHLTEGACAPVCFTMIKCKHHSHSEDNGQVPRNESQNDTNRRETTARSNNESPQIIKLYN